MKVNEFIERFPCKVLTDGDGLDRDISGGYICDLLSWVMANAKKDNIWITVLTNLNIVAVALLTEVVCVMIPENITVEETTIRKARLEGIILISTPLPAYEAAIKINELLAEDNI